MKRDGPFFSRTCLVICEETTEVIQSPRDSHDLSYAFDV